MSRIKLHAHYASHLPVLMKVVSITTGDVLELGTGIYSTPILNAMCCPHKRHVVSYDNDQGYLDKLGISSFAGEYHKVILVDDWDKIEIERPWDVAFIDHGPADRRKIETRRLANFARYVIVHDSDGRNEKHYDYKSVYPLFQYRYDYVAVRPHTTVLSNFVDLTGFAV